MDLYASSSDLCLRSTNPTPVRASEIIRSGIVINTCKATGGSRSRIDAAHDYGTHILMVLIDDSIS
jgi:hypothetical protein